MANNEIATIPEEDDRLSPIDIYGDEIKELLDEEALTALQACEEFFNNREKYMDNFVEKYVEVMENLRRNNPKLAELVDLSRDADSSIAFFCPDFPFLGNSFVYDGILFLNVLRQRDSKPVTRGTKDDKYFELEVNGDEITVKEIETLRDELFFPDHVDLSNSESWASLEINTKILEVLQGIENIFKMEPEISGNGKFLKAELKVLTKTDPMLAYIVEAHLEFTDDYLKSPLLIDGIMFFQVGRNSTHQFYMGTKDGKVYRYSSGEGVDYGLKPEERVNEVPDWKNCYWGHC